MTANPLSTIPPIGPATGMAPPPPSGRIKPIDPVRLLRRHIKLLIITGILGLMIGVGLYIGLRKLAPQYSSSTQLLVDVSAVDNPFDLRTGDNAAGGQMDGVVAFMHNESQLIVSDEIIRETLQRPTVKATEWYAMRCAMGMPRGPMRLPLSISWSKAFTTPISNGSRGLSR